MLDAPRRGDAAYDAAASALLAGAPAAHAGSPRRVRVRVMVSYG